MATRWFLVDENGSIVDEAEKKAIIMWRWGFVNAMKIRKIYMVHNHYIIKDVDMEKEGFGQALKNWDSRESEDD